jgi:hypothetical protein
VISAISFSFSVLAVSITVILTLSPTFQLVNSGDKGYIGVAMSTEKPFLSFVIEPELLKRLDDFRFKQRFASRAAAIKWLLGWALKQSPKVETQKEA